MSFSARSPRRRIIFRARSANLQLLEVRGAHPGDAYRFLFTHTGFGEPVHDTVSRVWRRSCVQPHRVLAFKLSNDSRIAEMLTDVVGLYLSGQRRSGWPAFGAASLPRCRFGSRCPAR